MVALILIELTNQENNKISKNKFKLKQQKQKNEKLKRNCRVQINLQVFYQSFVYQAKTNSRKLSQKVKKKEKSQEIFYLSLSLSQSVFMWQL